MSAKVKLELSLQGLSRQQGGEATLGRNVRKQSGIHHHQEVRARAQRGRPAGGNGKVVGGKAAV